MNMKPSSIEFITGVMNSGKSFTLIERIDEAVDRDLNILILKPSVDTRDGAYVKSRKTDRTYPATLVDDTDIYQTLPILDQVGKCDVLFLDEVQFFSADFIHGLILHTFLNGVAIVASGLTKDFKGEIFPSSLYLNTYATMPIEFKKSKCAICGKPKASIDVRMDSEDKLVTEGDSVSIQGTDVSYHYETVCPSCFKKKGGK